MIGITAEAHLSSIFSLPVDLLASLAAWHRKRVEKQRSIALAYVAYLDALSRHISDPTKWPCP